MDQEFVPMPRFTTRNDTQIGVSNNTTIGSPMRISLVTVAILVVVAFVVWKFVLKK